MIKENFSMIRENSQLQFEELKNELTELKAKDDLIKSLSQRKI